MKKIGLLLAALFVVIGVLIDSNKLLYPPLPIDSLTPKEAIQKLNASPVDLVALSNDKKATWYLTAISARGIQKVDEDIQQMMANEGWAFLEKEGSGLFFEKNGERSIVTTEMWTKQYVLVQIQK
ncbi:hypothetical protein [Lysinibacillus boronitolerans]|uniref:Lipoprotein n=1 Tax=Lysinibacillus boronitolerans JCM 21713 = 10a = NBRC 103108 TaxID=1294264 RepID=A0ABR4XW39_9BACI|nr:hypothetical protein [Lysinibacillus boronitolerans]KGR82933.1 hypothetical protein CD31_16155 [Lysinibacillus boronitolerans JCM 21713 = 10a = NBRC 103108]